MMFMPTNMVALEVEWTRATSATAMVAVALAMTEVGTYEASFKTFSHHFNHQLDQVAIASMMAVAVATEEVPRLMIDVETATWIVVVVVEVTAEDQAEMETEACVTMSIHGHTMATEAEIVQWWAAVMAVAL